MRNSPKPATVVRVGGISTLGLLGIMFVGLKLANVINWSWWWVTAPWWGPFALSLAIVIGAVIFALSAAVAVGFISWLGRRKKE